MNGLGFWVQEVRRNSRLRYGLWLLLALLLVNLLLAQHGRFQQAIGEKRRVEEQLMRTQFALNVDWQARLEAEQQVMDQFQPYLWQGESSGVIQANLQEEITEILDAVEVRSYRVRVGSVRPVKGAPGLWRLDVSAGGRFKRSNVPRLLSLLEQMEKKVMVQNLTISAARMNVLVSAYVVGIEDTEDEPG